MYDMAELGPFRGQEGQDLEAKGIAPGCTCSLSKGFWSEV